MPQSCAIYQKKKKTKTTGTLCLVFDKYGIPNKKFMLSKFQVLSHKRTFNSCLPLPKGNRNTNIWDCFIPKHDLYTPNTKPLKTWEGFRGPYLEEN